MKRLTIQELQMMRESEDHVEFKKGEGGNVSYNGSGRDKPNERRRCILGYVAALCNYLSCMMKCRELVGNFLKAEMTFNYLNANLLYIT